MYQPVALIMVLNANPVTARGLARRVNRTWESPFHGSEAVT